MNCQRNKLQPQVQDRNNFPLTSSDRFTGSYGECQTTADYYHFNKKKQRFTFGEVQEDVGGAIGLLQVVQDGGGAGGGPWVRVCVDAPQGAALRHAAEL